MGDQDLQHVLSLEHQAGIQKLRVSEAMIRNMMIILIIVGKSVRFKLESDPI